MDLTKYPMDKQTCTLQLESCKDLIKQLLFSDVHSYVHLFDMKPEAGGRLIILA